MPIGLFPLYLLNKVLLHNKLTFPSYNSLENIPLSNDNLFSKDMSIELKKTVIKRLEKPYDTECHDYGESNEIDCLNKCFLKKYLDKFNCIPNHNKYHTLVLNFTEDRKLFCPYFLFNITEFEKSIQTYCNNICDKPCIDTIFKANIENNDPSRFGLKLEIFFRDKFFYQYRISTKNNLDEIFN